MYAASRSLLGAGTTIRLANRGMSGSILTQKPTTSISRPGLRRMTEVTESSASDVKMNRVLVSPFQKRILVMSNMYPNLKEVPDKVSYQKLKKAKDWFRIRLNIGMGLATLIGCGTMIWAGKREHSWGDSVTRQNLRWHKQHHEEKTHVATETDKSTS